MSRITARDVGRLAGVHPSTVSRVLNRSFELHSYDPDTVRRIEQCAQQLGYQPSHAARSLRMGKTMLIGAVVSDIANTFFGEMVALIEHYARNAGYRTLICNTQDDADRQAEHLNDLLARQVDGMILSPSGTAGCDRVHAAKLPLVTVDRPVALDHTPFVGLDNPKAGQMLGEHLKRQNLTRIGVVMPTIPHDPTLMERFNGLLQGLGDAGQLVWSEADPVDQLATDTRARIVERLRDTDKRPQAIVGLTNHATLAALHAINDAGFAIASDVGLAGIDDFSAASVVRPGITIVAQPVARIAEQATTMLVDMMAQRPVEERRVLLEPVLIPRGSLNDAPTT